MRSLTDKFNELRTLLKNGLGSIRPTGFDPVYYIMFRPGEILEVKQRIAEWEAQLRVDGFNPVRLSMTDVVNTYFRQHELREALIAAASERQDELDVINDALAQHLVQDDVVGKAILDAIEKHRHVPNSVLLITDLEALHPYLRIGAVEQQLVGRFTIPTVILYPGTAGGAYSRRFLGVHKEDGNYRSPHID
jgi:hypothetical protein